MCNHVANHGIRFYYLIEEGINLHPNVKVVKNIAEADYVIYLPGSAPWHLTECTDKSYISKLIVLDEFDGYPLYAPYNNRADMTREYGNSMVWYNAMYKRAYTSRKDGNHMDYPHLLKDDVYPLTYSVAEEYAKDVFNKNREIDIMCTLRGHKKMSTRQRVSDWVIEYVAVKNITNAVLGQVNKGSRNNLNEVYFNEMYNAKIIVTVNPAHWEGDFRLWESLASGALVFVDPLNTPMPYPLIHGVHVIYFSNNDKDDLFQKLDYYRQHTGTYYIAFGVN